MASRASILESGRPGYVTVITPYHAGFVADIKSYIDYPFRQYDPNTKQWLVEKTHLETLIIILEKHFDEIHTDLRMDEAVSNSNLFQQVFDILPDEYINKVYASLAQAIHPDHGGSNQLMAELNEAYSQRRK